MCIMYIRIGYKNVNVWTVSILWYGLWKSQWFSDFIWSGDPFSLGENYSVVASINLKRDACSWRDASAAFDRRRNDLRWIPMDSLYE